MLPSNNEEGAVYTDNQDDLNRVCADMSAEIADAALALTDISDDGLFVEVKAEYAKEMVTGFIQLDGVTVVLLLTEQQYMMRMAKRQKSLQLY